MIILRVKSIVVLCGIFVGNWQETLNLDFVLVDIPQQGITEIVRADVPHEIRARVTQPYSFRYHRWGVRAAIDLLWFIMYLEKLSFSKLSPLEHFKHASNCLSSDLSTLKGIYINSYGANWFYIVLCCVRTHIEQELSNQLFTLTFKSI